MSDKAKTFGAERELRGGLIFMPEKLTIVGIDTDHKSEKEHPLWDIRNTYPISEQHILNAMEHGPDGAVEARKNGENKKTGEAIAEVIDGRTRTRAQRIANDRLRAMGKAPWPMTVIFRQMDGLDAMRKVNRSNLHVKDNPMARARKMKAALDRGADQEMLALDFGCTLPTVRDSLLLFDGSEKLQAAVQNYDITLSVAKKLISSGMSREEQDAALIKILADGKSGGEANEEAEQQVAEATAGKPKRRKSIGRVASRSVLTKLTAAIEERLTTKQAQLAKAVIAAIMGDTDDLFSQYGDLSDVAREILTKKKATRKRAKKKLLRIADHYRSRTTTGSRTATGRKQEIERPCPRRMKSPKSRRKS